MFEPEKSDNIKVKTSILIFTYDRIQFLRNAVDSVKLATEGMDNLEIIISSCLSSEKITAEVGSENLTFITLSANMSYGERIVETIKKSNGTILFFLEDDDLFLPEKIKKVISIFKEDESVVAVKDIPLKINSEKSLDSTKYDSSSILASASDRDESINLGAMSLDVFSRLKKSGTFLNPSTMTVKRCALEENFDILLCSDPADIMLMGSILNHTGKLKLLNTPLTIYRIHSSNDSGLSKNSAPETNFKRFAEVHKKFFKGISSAWLLKQKMNNVCKLLIYSVYGYENYINNLVRVRPNKVGFIVSVFSDLLTEMKISMNLGKKPSFISITRDMIRKIKERVPLVFIYTVSKKRAIERLKNYLSQ